MWPFGKSRAARLRRDLMHAAGFRSRLETDRLRADRMGIAMTLVTVRWELGNDPAESTARAFDVVEKHLRATDELGRLSDHEVAVVLWDTDEAGANVFVDRLLKNAPADLPLEATLFVYPSRTAKPRNENKSKPVDNDEDSPASNSPGGDSTSDNESAERPSADVPVEQLEPAMATAMSPLRRAVDFVGATIGLILASPILAIAAVAIKISDQGPVLFVQERAGLGGRPFRIYKLRTMCVNADEKKKELLAHSEQDGAAFKLTNDPRVFRVGQILRKTSIDELPQLINVIRGDMSLVGPRPLPVAEAEQVAGWQRRRLDVMPGLTCIWQVEGRSRVSFVEWMRMDMRYIQQRSLFEDIYLMFATIPAVLLRRGAK